jgi:hypothetical protein
MPFSDPTNSGAVTPTWHSSTRDGFFGYPEEKTLRHADLRALQTPATSEDSIGVDTDHNDTLQEVGASGQIL